MIGKVTKGKGFRGLADYLLRDGRGEIVAGPMAGRTPRELAAEFGQLRRLNPKLGRAVAHFSLSPSPDDPPMAADQWQAIAELFMAEMGWGEASGAPWCAVVHRDTHQPHLHLMACRIDQHGKTIADSNDFRRAEAAIRRIEAEFDLVAVGNPKPKRRITSRATLAPVVRTTSTTQPEETVMDAPTTLQPSNTSDLHVTHGPEPHEAGSGESDGSISAATHACVSSVSISGSLSEKGLRSFRRCIAEDNYSRDTLILYGTELAHLSKHGRVAVLHFALPEAGRICDHGDRITASSDMSEEAAARRVVTLATAPGRGWQSITFTGSPKFVELAMREALSRRLAIHARDAEQAAILDRLMAEQ